MALCFSGHFILVDNICASQSEAKFMPTNQKPSLCKPIRSQVYANQSEAKFMPTNQKPSLCQPIRSQVYVFAAEILSKFLSGKSINSLQQGKYDSTVWDKCTLGLDGWLWQILFPSVAEPKLFIFGSDSGYSSTFVHNFGSGSSSCHIMTLKTVLKQ